MRSYIHFIRHGITEGNLKRWYYGAADLPLANEGVDQLAALALEGIYPDPEGADIYTSGLTRCEQTLFLIYGNREHKIIDELKEINCGEFECRSHDELMADPRYVAWCDDKTGEMPMPGGETRNHFAKRVIEGYDMLFKYHQLKMLALRHKDEDARSIVVVHGGVISAIMCTIFDGGMDRNFWTWMPDPGRGYTLVVEDGEVTGYEKI